MNDLLQEALKLPAFERRRLADKIYDSIVRDLHEGTLTEKQRSEIDRRLADYEKYPEKLKRWEEVRELLRKIA